MKLRNDQATKTSPAQFCLHYLRGIFPAFFPKRCLKRKKVCQQQKLSTRVPEPFTMYWLKETNPEVGIFWLNFLFLHTFNWHVRVSKILKHALVFLLKSRELPKTGSLACLVSWLGYQCPRLATQPLEQCSVFRECVLGWLVTSFSANAANFPLFLDQKRLSNLAPLSLPI